VNTEQRQQSSLSYSEKNAKYWKQNLAVCVFGSFTTAVSLTMLLPFLPIFVEQLGITQKAAIVQWSALAFGATFLGTGLTAPLWGHLGDRYGRKPMLVRAAVGMTLIMSLIGLSHTIAQLVLLRLAAGLVGGYASSSMLLVATQTPKERAGWALGVLSTGALTGNLIGPLVGGVLPTLIGIRNTFFAGGTVIGTAMLATIFLVREDRQSIRSAPSVEDPSAMSQPLQQRSVRIVVAAMLSTAMLVLLANMSIEPIITVYLETLKVTKGRLVLDAGFIMAASAFGSILMAPRFGRLADRIGGWKVISLCLLATSVTLVPQAFVTQWWQLGILRFLLGMCLAGLLPSVAKVIRHSIPERQLGKVLGYSQSSQYAGQVIGPLMGGAMGAHFGMRSVFLATGAMTLVGAAANWICEQLVRKQDGKVAILISSVPEAAATAMKE
jgi:DHA1 family multidrug resistance protein-like MFS transporter